MLDHAREELGTTAEIATALADNLPVPKLTARKSRRRRRKRKGAAPADAPVAEAVENAEAPEPTGAPDQPEVIEPAAPVDVEDAA
jgi:hypothetical protein